MVIGVYSLLTHVVMKTRWIGIPTAAAATFAIVLIWLLIPPFAAVGAGIALATSGLVAIVLLHLWLLPLSSCSIHLSELIKSTLSVSIIWLCLSLAHTIWVMAGWIITFSVTFLLVSFIYLHYHWIIRDHLVDKEYK